MAVALYMDVHIPRAITRQLRVRGVNVVAATEEETNTLPDDALLEQATSEGRTLVTSDIRFKALAEDWQREGRIFAGLIYGHARLSVGDFIHELEIIAKTSEPDELAGTVIHLPL